MRTRIGEFRSMSFSVMAWISFGGTGWLALALVASDISSPLQPTSTTPTTANAAEGRSARRTEREIKGRPPHPPTKTQQPQPRHNALNTLTKILPIELPRHNPNASIGKAHV